MEPEDGGGVLRVHRRLDGGRREVLLVPRPAVVSVEAAGIRLRRAGLPATLASGHVAIPVVRAPAATAAHRIRVLGAHPYRPRPRELAGPSGSALRRTLELTGALVERTPPTVLGPLSPGQAADELLGYLRRHGYLADSDAG
jgi:electron transfer flavoprotein beta subunit